MTDTTTTDTQLVIVEAALNCFRTQGLRKTTIVDIGRAAGVSRSTIYEYFPDKRAIVDAASEHASQLFYRGMARAMDRGGSLEDKLSRAAVAVTRARRFIDPDRLSDAEEVNLLLTRNAGALLRECGEFLTPYLTAAKLTGEVRKSLDVAAAAEWFARMLFSLFMTPSERLDLTDTDAVAEFVREHVVRGYVDSGPSRPRRGAHLR
jgi:AcrR family transcriptional regulator